MKQLTILKFFRTTLASAFCIGVLTACTTVPYVATPAGPVGEDMVLPVTVNTRSTTTLPSYSPTLGGWFHCAKLKADKGTSWVVTEKEPLLAMPASVKISVGRGSNCTNATWLISRNMPEGLGIDTKVEFTAGGGEYLILLQNFGGIAGGFAYEVNQVNASPEFVQLQPGLLEYIAPQGTASTVTTVPAGPRYKPGDTFRDCEHCPEMAALPAGSFFMGSDQFEEGRDASEGPRHRVTFSRSFAIGTKEVTFDEYDACVHALGCFDVSDRGWGRGNRPVLNLKWIEVMNYVAWLSATTGQQYFIPSEAEWEYAARAGTDTPWNTGDSLISEDANFFNQFQKTVPVGSYAPNGFGLYDTHGNVLEWVQDCLDVGYVGVPSDGSAAIGPPCNSRIVRGGAYSTNHARTRSAARFAVLAATRYTDTGFRVTRSLPQ